MEVIKKIKVVGFVVLFLVLLVMINILGDKYNTQNNATENTTPKLDTPTLSPDEGYLESLTLLHEPSFSSIPKSQSMYVQNSLQPVTHIQTHIKQIESEQISINQRLKKHEGLIQKYNKLASALFISKQLNIHLENHKTVALLSKSLYGPETVANNRIKWEDEIKNEQLELSKLQTYIQSAYAQPTTDPKWAAILLSNNINQLDIYTCPLFEQDGSRLTATHPIYHEIIRTLFSANQDKKRAKYFFSAQAKTDNQGDSEVNYQLVDKKSNIILTKKIYFTFQKSEWERNNIQVHDVLLDIDTNLTAQLTEPSLSDSSEEELYQLVSQTLPANKHFIAVDPCRPITQFSNHALSKVYGVSSLMSVKVSGRIRTKVTWPDPKEHQVAQVVVNFKYLDLYNTVQINEQQSEARHFPVLNPYNALLAATEKALIKLR